MEGWGEEKKRALLEPPGPKKKKHSAVCLPCNPGVFRACESVVGGRGAGRSRCVKDKQTKKKFQSAVAADLRRDELLGVSVGASGTNTSSQSEAACAASAAAAGK